VCWQRLTNSLTIFDEPLRASLCTLDSSLLDDFDFDLDVDLEADVDFEADVLDLEAEVLDLEADVLDLNVLAVRDSAMVESVVVLNGWWEQVAVC
jgi:hypothetical protein